MGRKRSIKWRSVWTNWVLKTWPTCRTLRATNFVLRIWRQKTSGWLVEVATWHAATINNPLKASRPSELIELIKSKVKANENTPTTSHDLHPARLLLSGPAGDGYAR